ncbi:S-adenosyl-L-methionine-dependent methyltransferase [Hypoxylon trugodes]|uniref:S-adenosyl-L-methionine-dependent methyltransferase n=1 Tax=Hypoxylon trugodes TaxID=326681 RepID=UPI0021947BBE|nr:S-adenosyl-L-methionine-dependent methyltransferase [Hypoxylon trugodes]KAI1393582.1 S-adenosyl-L-methionine-dependent methyltransferase [Hypoxylon trugodes]
MPSQATSVTDSSVGPVSSENRRSVGISELPVPELDNDISTEDYSSDYLSSWTASAVEPESRILGPHDELATSHADTASIYSPSHYPTVSRAYRIELPFDDDTPEEETLDSTRSINELDLNYVMENGRRYCGSYYMPNDDDEQVRLQLINQVYLKTFEGELTSVPLEAPTHILDIGTGVGEWAIEMAELYPDSEVTGTDISNIFERRVPQNVYWEIDDAELEWERPPNQYDLVHLRDMTGSFSDWQYIYRSAFSCIKPGGWIEVLDFDDRMVNFQALFAPGSIAYKVAQDLDEACVLHGRPRGVSHLEPRFLVNAGYVDVQLTEHAIPLRTEDGSTGKFWLLAMLNGMESTCLRLLTRYKGWEASEVRLACDIIGQELMGVALNPKRARGIVVKARVLKGRKPNPNSRWSRGISSIPSNTMQQKLMEMMGETDTEEANLTDGESGYCSFPSDGPISATSSKLFGSSVGQKQPTETETVSGTE